MDGLGHPPEVGILIYPGVQFSAAHGLTDILGIGERIARERSGIDRPTLRVTHWQLSADGTSVACAFDTLRGAVAAPRFILIPLTLVDRPPAPTMSRLAAWLRARHADGATLASVCSGAFLLAETGLLAGRVASTHWSCADELKAKFPDIRVDTGVRIVDYGDIITVGGFMAWVDLALSLIAQILGPTIAEETARFLLVDAGEDRRHYMQGFTPRLHHGDAAVLRAQHWIHSRDGRDASLAVLAEQAGLEKRTFLRRFVRATEMTPIEYCRNVRIARARELLEFSRKTLKEMAWEVGYEDTRGFARAFRRVVGVSPSEYRRRFAFRQREPVGA